MNGLYQVSDLGRVRNKYNRVLSSEYSNKGYACTHLRKDGKSKKCRIHRLVAEAFIPNPDNLPEVNHKDEDKMNNSVKNLEWCTHAQNMAHYTKNHPESIFGKQPVYCFDLDEYFKSISEASVHTGIARSSITKACTGKQKSAGGKWWCYAKDKDTKKWY